MEHLLGFEPRTSGWKPTILPLKTINAHIYLVLSEGIEPTYPACKTGVLPLN
jgi:hypothetical protein